MKRSRLKYLGPWPPMLIVVLIGMLSACSKDGPSVTATASIFKGGKDAGARSLARPTDRLASGNWRLSPDEAQLTFVAMSLTDPSADGGKGKDRQVDLSDCVVTYKRMDSGGAKLKDCQFSIPVGTYTKIWVAVSTTYKIKITDSVKGIYTDSNASTGIGTTAPTGGATFIDYTIQADGGATRKGSTLALPIPFEVKEGTTPTISIVTDMNSTVMATVANNVMTLDSNVGDLPVDFVGIPGSGGSAGFYSNQSTFEPNGNTQSTNIKFAKVFYDSNGTPVMASIHRLCNVGTGPSSAYSFGLNSANALSFKAGYYLGIDSSNVVGWAIPNADSSQFAIYKLAKVTTLNGSTTLTCTDGQTSTPAPSSGDTYSSGAPSFTAKETHTLKVFSQ